MNTPESVGAAPTADERTWGLFAHLSALIGFILPLGSILAPLVIWLVKREQSAFVGENAKEALNFNITIAIAGIVSAILIVVFIGILLLIAVGIFWLVMTIIAGIKANEGQVYRYPMTIRLVK